MGQITRVGGDVDTRLEKAGRVDQMWMKKVFRSIIKVLPRRPCKMRLFE